MLYRFTPFTSLGHLEVLEKERKCSPSKQYLKDKKCTILKRETVLESDALIGLPCIGLDGPTCRSNVYL